MRIATLTIDGFSKESEHLPKLLCWLRERQPDIVALQKIGSESRFRSEVRPRLDAIGYHCRSLPWRSGTDPGVAILSRKKLGNPRCLSELPGSEGTESRFLAVDIGGLWVASLYAPYGNPRRWKKALGNRLAHEKAIDERVIWLGRLREHIREAGYAHRNSLLCGDFNVKTKSDGPPKGSAYSEREQDELEEPLKLGFSDLYDQYRRDHSNVPEGFTFGFTKEKPRTGSSRLHLAIASKGLAERLVCASVDTDATIRAKARPLVVEFADPSQ